MSDISDLHGVFATTIRWNAETGTLGYSAYDETTGEREIIEIELGSPMAKFVMDYATRERGYGLIRQGVYDMRLSPVGSPAPDWPGDDYKPAIGCWLWNPLLSELRLESNQTTVVRAISALWDRARTLAEGLQPLIHFTDRREQFYRRIGKTFWAPVIDLIIGVPRDKVPAFALREPTVTAPLALDNQVRFALLGAPERDIETRDHESLDRNHPKQPRSKSRGPAKRGSLNDFLDDDIPEDL
jgi:hypothetical protein